MFRVVLVIRGEAHNNGQPMFVQLEDISHNEGSLQGQQLQYPEKLQHKATTAPDCSLPLLHPPLFIFAHSLSISVAHISCKNTMDLTWACIYIYIHSNSGTGTRLYLKHAKLPPVLGIKEMSTLSNLKNTSQKRGGEIIWIKSKNSLNKLSRNEKLVGGNLNATEGKWERAWRVATEW